VRPLRPATVTEQEYTEFDPAFERALIYASCTVPRFWSLIGTHLNPECLRDKRGVELLKACDAIARETGEGPSRAIVVIQRLLAEKESGRMTQANIDNAVQLLEDVDDLDEGIPSLDDLVASAASVLRTRAHNDIVRRIVQDNGKGKPLTRYAAEIEAAERIGKESATGSTKLSSAVWAGIDELRRADRLPTGILQLDDPISGGITPRSLLTVGAETGVGKTALLVHIASYAWLAGKRVIFVPTEEGVSETLVRAIGWITGIDLERVGRSDKEAKTRLARLIAAPGVGALAIEYLPQGATVGQLRQLVDQAVEDHPEFGGGFDLLVVDYADKLEGKGDRAYDKMKSVYEGLRQIAVDNNNWAVTASQLKETDRKKIPDANDLSDSRWKGRISDAVLTVWRPEDGDPDERMYHWAKIRGAGAGTVVGPLPTEFDRGRMAPLPADSLLDDDGDVL
jgi:KaiC/GvpD/RAD55 family RecA-like ATPase